MKKHFCEEGCLTERDALKFSEERNNNLMTHQITENHVFTGQTTFQTSLGKKHNVDLNPQLKKITSSLRAKPSA